MGEDFNNNAVFLKIANLVIKIKTPLQYIYLEIPDCHKNFFISRPENKSLKQPGLHYLSLNFNNKPFSKFDHFQTKIAKTDIWELWENLDGDYLFYLPREIPSKCVLVSRNFKNGEILGELFKNGEKNKFPLKHIDMIIYSNWLAEFGDLILHASGVAIDGMGYAFIGESGRGKSTLVSNLSKHHDLTILGEDQVILRKINGEFWIFGTPWHLNPEYCSPIGVPLKNLFVLDRSAAQVTSSLNPMEAMTAIMQTAFIPYYRKSKVEGIIDCLDLLVRKKSIHKLSYQLGTNILPFILNP